MKALWTRPESEVSEEYKNSTATHTTGKTRSNASATRQKGQVNFALCSIYRPSPFDLFFQNGKHGYSSTYAAYSY